MRFVPIPGRVRGEAAAVLAQQSSVMDGGPGRRACRVANGACVMRVMRARGGLASNKRGDDSREARPMGARGGAAQRGGGRTRPAAVSGVSHGAAARVCAAYGKAR